MGQLQVEVLGRSAVVHGGSRLTLGSKATALVCYLAVTGERHPRGALAGLLWGELPEDRARANLRLVLSDLRKDLGGHLDISGREVGPRDGWRVDLAELAGVSAGGNGDEPEHVRALARGEFLAGLDVPGAPAFDVWRTTERERVRQLMVDRLRTVARATADVDPEQALAVARELVALDPFDEAAHRLVMELLSATGRRAAALAQYETCRLVLADELGVDPSSATVALRDRLLLEDAGMPLVDVAPRGDEDQPTRDRVADGGAAQRLLHRLPVTTGPLVGREVELGRLAGLLTDDACRLVTLVGPGGVGKTRLAVAAADALAGSFTGGTAFVPLAALAPGESEAAIAGAMAMAMEVPPWRDSPVDALRRAIADRHLLVVLDNVEQVDVGSVVSSLLDACPGLTLLATSRQRIGLGAEWLLDVGGLPYPHEAAADLERHPAPALFAQRARRVRPDFTIADDPGSVLRICRLVEGLPLAIELAADWMRSLEPGAVADLIAQDVGTLATQHDVVEARQRSMRSVLDASWRLLDDDQQLLLARLSVFRGGFDPDAALAVAGATPGDLSRLVDRSVVQPRPGSRFDLHELLRQYAGERLGRDHDDSEAARSRHADHFAAVAAARAGAVADRDEAAIERLETDLANLREAASWLIAHGDEDRLAPCVACLWHLDHRQGRYGESLALLEAALARPKVSQARTATWRRWAGAAAFQLGQMERAETELMAAFAALGQRLPRRSAGVVVALVREAVRQGAHRLRAPRQKPGESDRERERIEALTLLVNTAYYLQQGLAMGLYALLEANAADRGADAGAASCAYAELGHGLQMLAWRRLAARYLARADAAAARASNSDLLYAGFENRAVSHLAVGEWEAVDAKVRRIIASAPTADTGQRILTARAIGGASHLFRGQFAQALDAFEVVLDEARTAGHDIGFLWLASGVTDSCLGLGRDLESVGLLQVEAVARSTKLGAPERMKGVAVLTAVRLAEGQFDEVLTLARTGVSILGEVRFYPVWALDGFSHLAQAWLTLWDQAGEPDPELVRGSREACQALAGFARAYPVGTARSLWAAGWLAHLDGRPRRAQSSWRRSLEMAERLRMPYDQARAHVALADAADDESVAAGHRAHARALLADLGIRPALVGLRPSTAALTLD